MASTVEQYSFDYFNKWGQDCRVRKVQHEIEDVAQKAREKNKTIDEELADRGYKGHSDFTRSCPQFDLTCSPLEFKELGSGFVLYFYFLGFMVAVLLMVSLVTSPAMAIYAGEDWSQGSDAWIGTFWLTPGNLGLDQADQKWIPFLYFAIVCLIAFMTLVMSQHQIYTDSKVDAGTTSPNDFAIMVKGLPKTATDEAGIAAFFREHAVNDQTDTEIVKVVIGWDVTEYTAKMKQMRELRLKLAEQDVASPEYENIKKQMMALSQDLAACAPDRAARLSSSGVVVVVFRKQADLRACLQRWTSFWARWCYSDYEDVGCLPAGNMLCKGNALPKFPLGGHYINAVEVERAANPGDIHWEELGMSVGATMKLFMQTNAIMVAIVLTCAACTFGLNKWQEHVEENQQGGFGLSALLGFAVSIVNMILMVSARTLGDREYHETWTSQEFSQAAKMTLALFLNTAGVMLFSALRPRDWFSSGGLIDDAKFVLIFDAIIPPLVFMFDIKYYLLKGIMRRKLKQDKLDTWNAVMQHPVTSKEAAQERMNVMREANMFKKAWEPSEMDYPRRYANAMNTFLCTLLFSPVFPLAPVIGCVGLTLQYWSDKYLLVRWYKRPARPYNARLACWSLKLIKFVCPLMLSVSFYFFLAPIFAEEQDVIHPFILSLAVSAGMIFIPTTVLRTVLCMRCFMGAKHIDIEDDKDDYYQVQHTWSKEMKYHKDHFLYAKLPEKVNPEFLEPGQTCVTKLEDVKGSYGEATEQGTDKDMGDTGLTLTGGKKLGAMRNFEGDIETGKTAAYGVAIAAEKPSQVESTHAVAIAEESDTKSPDDSAAEFDTKSSEELSPHMSPNPADHHPLEDIPDEIPVVETAGAKPIWEWQHKDRWTAYGDDCNEYIEKRYQEFIGQCRGKGKSKGKSKGQSYIHVKTQGKEISIDFSKMTSKAKDSSKISQIRRREP